MIRHFFERSNALIILISPPVIYYFIFNDLIHFKFESEYEFYAYENRLYGSKWFLFWGPFIIKGLLPQLFWIKKIRVSILPALVMVALLILNFYLPVFASSHNDYLPSGWSYDMNVLMLLGTFFLYSFFIMARDISVLWK